MESTNQQIKNLLLDTSLSPREVLEVHLKMMDIIAPVAIESFKEGYSAAVDVLIQSNKHVQKKN